MANLITIERHILEQQRRRFPNASGAFTQLMYDIALTAKLIDQVTRRAGLNDILGGAEQVNVQGEEQQKLDVYAHDLFVRMLDHTGRVSIMASEEEEGPIHIPEPHPIGDYVVLFDPLDGSSNIKYTVGVGTIFAVYNRVSPAGRPGTVDDLLQPGHRMAAAGYLIFGSSTMLIYSAGAGVHGFTLDPNIGEFLLSHPDMTFPKQAKYYSVNHSQRAYWADGMNKYVDHLSDITTDPKLSLRYTGSLVSDFHRNLLAGGIYIYAAMPGHPKTPHGKLRLLYECNPLAFIAEQAGGAASDGVGRILDVKPTELHQRTPFIVGNKDLVDTADSFIKEHDAEWSKTYKESITYASREAAR